MNPYILLRAALALFKKPPAELNSQQLTQATKQAQKEYQLEQRVLNSPQAVMVIIPAAEVQDAYQQVRSRYDDEASFRAVLADNHLTIESLKDALYRQTKVNTVLDMIAAAAEKVEEVEIELFYYNHPEKFSRPEQREVCHILISINPQYPENSRANALQRIQEVQRLLKQDISKFADLALKHSECPTALQSGLLGTLGRGKLYPELEQVLFNLAVDEISEVVESEIGFHVLHCKKIYPANTMTLEQALPRIRQSLQDRSRVQKQRQCLASLPIPSAVKEHDYV
jgi:peptidyl-prolyl cis-trans isomerase C